jgi:dipeptidyl aminopeptidase/acylaminoacyl peptidase
MNRFLITLFCCIFNTLLPQFTISLDKIKLKNQDNKKKIAKYGSWLSPINAKIISEETVTFSEINLKDGTVYWLELRPWQKGRVALMSYNKMLKKELLPEKYSVKSKINEYGGGALLVTKNKIYFVNYDDQQIYCREQNGSIKKITSIDNVRFADGCFNYQDESLYYVMEDHRDKKVKNSIVKITVDGCVKEFAAGNDFYSNPRISPDGKELAYITWNHPNMPWDGTELWVVDLTSGQKKLIAGGVSESVLDPKWSPDGQLYYVSDRNGWWNLYRAKSLEPVVKIEGEFVLPPWELGSSLIGFSGKDIYCSYVQNAVNKFLRIFPNDNIRFRNLPFTRIDGLAADKNYVALIAVSPQLPISIILFDKKTDKFKIIRRGSTVKIDPQNIAEPISIEFPTTNGQKAYAFYYAPKNKNYKAPKDELPPLIVMCHGGPSYHVTPSYSWNILFWTSRGYAVVDVNYGGSTGYGKAYRERLNGQWGIVDVDDCTNAAIYCVEHGLADKNRLAIEGGSAGGFTVLSSMIAKNNFKVGANYYGVTDLLLMLKETHKFESNYFDKLIGPFPLCKQLYIERSPVNNIDKIKNSVIIFQGGKDAIVPPSQSQIIYDSLVAKKIPTAYLLFKDERHGFDIAENIQKALEAQLYFFSKIFKIKLVDKIEPIKIDNLS